MKLDFEVDKDDIAFTYVNDSVKGTLNRTDTHVLLQHFSQLPFGSKYIETGSYLGCSSVLAGLTMKANSLVYAHDLWLDNMNDLSTEGAPPPQIENYFYTFYNNIRENNLEGIVIPIRGDSSYTLGIHENESIDLAFIDGDHSYDGATRDLKAVYPKMKPGSFILCHDATTGSPVRDAIANFVSPSTSVNGFQHSSIVRITV